MPAIDLRRPRARLDEDLKLRSLAGPRRPSTGLKGKTKSTDHVTVVDDQALDYSQRRNRACETKSFAGRAAFGETDLREAGELFLNPEMSAKNPPKFNVATLKIKYARS